MFSSRVPHKMQNLGLQFYSFVHKLIVRTKTKLALPPIILQFKDEPKTKYFNQLICLRNEMANSLMIAQSKQLSDCSNCKKGPTRKGRHSYHQDCENIVNEQIYEELKASLMYLAMASYFGRTDVAFPGCHGYFLNMHLEEHEHAMVFFNYQLMRGADVKLKTIEAPDCHEFPNMTGVFEKALDMEIHVKDKLMEVCRIATENDDLHLQDLITTDFMEEQNRSIMELGRLIAQSRITDTPLGKYMFDKMIFDSYVKKNYNKLMHKRNLQNTESEAIYK